MRQRPFCIKIFQPLNTSLKGHFKYSGRAAETP
jgi:hypothetical protein